jgi:hypothetical protein
LVLQSLGGVGPCNRAMAAFLRGHWLPAEFGPADVAPSLAVGLACFGVAMAVRRSARAPARPRR